MNEGLVVLVRSIIGFFTLLILARVLGKQQISQLTFFDYVLGITIGSIAATLSVDLSSRAWPHWVGLMVWALIVWALQWFTLKYRSAGQIYCRRANCGNYEWSDYGRCHAQHTLYLV